MSWLVPVLAGAATGVLSGFGVGGGTLLLIYMTAFAGRVAGASGLTPVLWDERLTTIEAHAILHAGGKKMKSHKKNVDAVAAALILEGYLTRKRIETRE